VEDDIETVEAPRRSAVKTSAPEVELTLAVLQQRRSLAWRRFFAKQIDMTIAIVLAVTAAAAIGWTDVWALVKPQGWLIILAPALLWIPVEAAMLALFGWTPGRLMLGLRVVDKSGSTPGFFASLKRSALIWAGGLGFGLPVETILPLAQWMYTFWHFQRFGNTLWDHSAGTQVIFRELNRGHATGLALFTAAMASLTAWIFLYVPVPERITGENRQALEQIGQTLWKMAAPAPAARDSKS
jgi:uncharacterized RDD family membrane protein YckC